MLNNHMHNVVFTKEFHEKCIQTEVIQKNIINGNFYIIVDIFHDIWCMCFSKL